jgi:hypothetical protein
MVGLGLLGCAIACALPFLVGLLGVSTGLAALARQAESLGAVVVVGGAILVVAGVWRRRPAVAGGKACAGSCGCASPSVETGGPGHSLAASPGAPFLEEPIACTLDGGGMRNRLEEFREVFGRGFIRGERIEDGFRWRFRVVPGLEGDLRALAEREHACCRFFRFDLFPANQGQEIWWEARANPEAAPVLEAFFRLPEELGVLGGLDLDAIQRSAAGAFQRAERQRGSA